MRIEIGCSSSDCGATTLAECLTDSFDEPCTGLFLPEGWEAENIFQRPTGTRRWTSVSFSCPECSSYTGEKATLESLGHYEGES